MATPGLRGLSAGGPDAEVRSLRLRLILLGPMFDAGPAGSGERPGYQLEAVGTVEVAGDVGIGGVGLSDEDDRPEPTSGPGRVPKTSQPVPGSGPICQVASSALGRPRGLGA